MTRRKTEKTRAREVTRRKGLAVRWGWRKEGEQSCLRSTAAGEEEEEDEGWEREEGEEHEEESEDDNDESTRMTTTTSMRHLSFMKDFSHEPPIRRHELRAMKESSRPFRATWLLGGCESVEIEMVTFSLLHLA
jgi:hypothetical protein